MATTAQQPEPAVTRSAGKLVAVVVGIDRYADPTVPDLRCAANDAESVANALRLTQPPEALELDVLMSPRRRAGVEPPTRRNILAAARRAAGVAGAEDTVLLYFAGHGGILGGRPCLLPVDVDCRSGEVQSFEKALIGVGELQDAFEGAACRQRVMVLDCCQSPLSEGESEGTADGAASRALQWRTGAPASEGLMESFQQQPRGWSILLSCSANELSLEDPDWGEHGIFSHFLAVGLKGEGDLDGDGTVSLAELVQYLANRVSKQAKAVIREITERGEPAPQRGQNPTLISGGPVAVPLTRRIEEGRARFDVGVLRLWSRFLRRRLPYTLTVEGMVRYGTGFLYGGSVAATVLLFARRPFAGPWPWLAAAALPVSAFLWIAGFAMAGAANERRWHTGGYVSSLILLAWHVVLLAALIAVGARTPGWEELPEAAVRLGIDLFVLISLMVVFGFNELQCIISLADLLKHDERVTLRRVFRQLDQRWIHADVPNVLAMVSAHPRLYQIVGLVCSLLVLAHAGYLLLSGPIDARVAVAFLRDVLLL
ncbi:MAG: caspase family protein, partial [Candidatus Brocadiaceae bacterium]